MKHKNLFLCVACSGLLSLFGCKKDSQSTQEEKTSGLVNNRVTQAVVSPASASFSLTTIGSDIQEFNELKSAGSENTRLGLGFTWSDFAPTGFHLPPNATVQLNVEQLAGSTRPQLLIGTYSRYLSKWNPQSIQLTAGVNNITTDAYGGLLWVRFGTSGTPSSRVRITFVSGHQRVPVYIKNQTTDWANQLSTYATAPDVVLVGDRVYQVYSRTRALNTQSQDNNYVLTKADQIMNAEDDISGLDGSAPQHQPNVHTRVLMTETDNPDGWMTATAYRTYYVNAAASSPFTASIGSSSGWGPWHELGHMHQQQAWKWSGLGEVTVNIYSLAAERSMGVTPSRLKRDNIWPQALTFLANNKRNKDFNAAFSNDVWIRLCMFHQLWLAYGDNFYKQLHKQTRVELPAVSTDAQKMRYFMLKACTISGHNLTNFFKKWGFKVDSSVYAEIANLGLPQPTVEPSTLSE